jgi:hypothetical protein
MAIRTLSRDDSLSTLWEDLVYTEARLLNDPEAKDLAEPITSLIARVEAARTGQRSARRAEIIAQSAIDAADDRLDDLVAQVAQELLYLCGQNREDPRFKRYFPRPPSLLIKQGLQNEVESIRTWTPSLKSEPEASLQALGEQLEALLADARSALESRHEAAAHRMNHRIREIYALVDDINATRRSIYGILVQRGSEKKKPRDWPNRFFARGSRSTPSLPPPL